MVLTISALAILAFHPNQNQDEIVEGVSVGKVKLGMTVNEVESIISSTATVIKWSDYSYEYKYEDLGVSIWEKQSDSTHTIFAISVNPKKWEGRTRNDLEIHPHLSVEEVLGVYGSPEWGFSLECKEFSADYDSLGIYFEIDPFIQENCDEDGIDYDSILSKHEITELTIGIIGTYY